MMEKTIIRREHNGLNPYAQVNRKVIQNPNLSWKAKGLLAYLLSLPDNWQIYVKELSNHSKDGIKATRTAFRELIHSGHIVGQKRRSNQGRFLGFEYVVIEKPETRTNQQSHPRAQKRHAVKGTLLNKDLTPNELDSLLDDDTRREKQQHTQDIFHHAMVNSILNSNSYKVN